MTRKAPHFEYMEPVGDDGVPSDSAPTAADLGDEARGIMLPMWMGEIDIQPEPGDMELGEAVCSDQVREMKERDPRLAKALKNFDILLRKAHRLWKDGKFASAEDAVEAVVGSRPEKLDDDDLIRLVNDMNSRKSKN